MCTSDRQPISLALLHRCWLHCLTLFTAYYVYSISLTALPHKPPPGYHVVLPPHAQVLEASPRPVRPSATLKFITT